MQHSLDTSTCSIKFQTRSLLAGWHNDSWRLLALPGPFHGWIHTSEPSHIHKCLAFIEQHQKIKTQSNFLKNLTALVLPASYVCHLKNYKYSTIMLQGFLDFRGSLGEKEVRESPNQGKSRTAGES